MDIDKIRAVQNLDNALALETFVGKFPVEMKKSYIKLVSEAEIRMKRGFEVMNLFMLQERKKV